MKKDRSKVEKIGYAQGYKQGINEADERAVNTVLRFIAECEDVAEKNWCPAQIDMLERLFGAVIQGVAYSQWERPDETN